MPRNRSEKLTSCPEAIIYADYAQMCLHHETYDNYYHQTTRSKLWRNIPQHVRRAIENARGQWYEREGPTVSGTRVDLTFNVKYIREHYAP